MINMRKKYSAQDEIERRKLRRKNVLKGPFKIISKKNFSCKADQRWSGCVPRGQRPPHGDIDKLVEVCKPFSEEKIRADAWGLGTDKAPGTDGFSVFFYRQFWDIVKTDIIRLFDCLHNESLQLD